jgi:hypothetical protein
VGEPHVEDVFAVWVDRRASGEKTAGLVELYKMAAAAQGVEVSALSAGVRARLTTLALPVLEPGYQVVAGSERADSDPIFLVPYDPTWPAQFETWRARLVEVLAEPPSRIEHVGSTAVPGLASRLSRHHLGANGR